MAAEAEAAREARAKVTCRIDNRDTWENCHRMDNVICMWTPHYLRLIFCMLFESII